MFKQFLKDIYPEELVVLETPISREICHTSIYRLTYQMVTLFAQIFDKRGAFDFDIVNVPDLPGNIPTAPAYGTYISQLIRYSRACHNYDNFSSRHSMLAERLFNQGFSVTKLMRTFYKFMDRYPELATKFSKSPSPMICDRIPMAQLYHTFP